MAEIKEEASLAGTGDQRESEGAESVAREREARRTRRRLERERQKGTGKERRPKLVLTDFTTVSGGREKRVQSEARTSARLDMRTETRRVVSTLSHDGALRAEAFGVVGGVWTSLGFIALDPEAD